VLAVYSSLSRRATLALLGASALSSAFAAGSPTITSISTPDAAFADLVKRWLEGSLRLSPVYATAIGDHRFDGERGAKRRTISSAASSRN
jgi:hypothetical protein